MKYKIKNICCIGAGYVGGPTMAVIAHKCPQIQVNVVDKNEKRINQWNEKNLNNLPIYEPGLDHIIKSTRDKNLHFSNEIEENIRNADMIFISVNTPTKKKGIGAGKASDLKWVEACAREVSFFAEGHTIIVEKSTLPVRTAQAIKAILESSQKSLKNNSQLSSFDVLSNPEFLSEGTAINDLLDPDRVLIGGENENAINALTSIYRNWVPSEKILITNVWSSELAKLSANVFLAQRISSINSISALCENTGADIREVSKAIGSDSRIGSKFLESGPGFGGSCFKKDILNLVYLSEYFGLPEVAKFWNQVVEINIWQHHRISKIITKKLFGNLSKKKIVILGFSFKANTNDTRESAAIQICKDLLDEGAFLFINDPKVSSEQIKLDLGINYEEEPNANLNQNEYENGWIFSDLKDIFIDADAVVIMTEWAHYYEIDWVSVSQVMRSPAWIFDTRSVVNLENILKAGLNLWRVGDGS